MNPPSSCTAFRVVDGKLPRSDDTGLSVAEMVRQGIAKAQEKLIDLSMRNRDRLRQDVLEGLNWTIHRVWSTDWYRNPEREITRLLQNIEAD
jgi:REase_MTES_1575